MVVTTFSYEQIESWVGSAFWPFLRIGACLMVAPMFSASYVPARVRIVLAGALTVVALPMILITFFLSLSGRFPAHRRLARFTFPVWLYVSVTGVITYVMLRLAQG